MLETLRDQFMEGNAEKNIQTTVLYPSASVQSVPGLQFQISIAVSISFGVVIRVFAQWPSPAYDCFVV